MSIAESLQFQLFAFWLVCFIFGFYLSYEEWNKG